MSYVTHSTIKHSNRLKVSLLAVVLALVLTIGTPAISQLLGSNGGTAFACQTQSGTGEC